MYVPVKFAFRSRPLLSDTLRLLSGILQDMHTSTPVTSWRAYSRT